MAFFFLHATKGRLDMELVCGIFSCVCDLIEFVFMLKM